MLFLIILILTFICSFFWPWWVMAIIAVIAGYICNKKPGLSFLLGFAAVFIAWTVVALMKTLPNDNILAIRVANLLTLNGNWVLLLILTGFIGGLVGGLSALSGALVKKAFGSK
jgi:hypothetical protein